MANRNEQFVYFVGVLAVLLPAVVWGRFVAPARAELVSDRLRVDEIKQKISSIQTPLLVNNGNDRERIHDTRQALKHLMGPLLSVSQVYRGIELSASNSGLTVDRIEPNRVIQRSETQGPLGQAGLAVDGRTYRIELHGPMNNLAVFLDELTARFELLAIREVRAHRNGTECTATVLIETIGVVPLETAAGES